MNWLNRASKLAIDRMPKTIDAKTHAKIDYAMAAAMAGFGIMCLRNNKAAGMAATIASLAQVTNVAMTDVPGGICKTISFPLHGRVDMALTGILATMPAVLGFSDTKESRIFALSAVAMSVVTAMTDFTGTGERAQSQALLNARA
jgi:hypothetical protein